MFSEQYSDPEVDVNNIEFRCPNVQWEDLNNAKVNLIENFQKKVD